MKWRKYGQIRLSPAKDEFEIHIDKRERGGWFLTCAMLGIDKHVLPIKEDEEAQKAALQVVSDKLDGLLDVRKKLKKLLLEQGGA